jgi:putative nucleotidyltransferase with HDIG domain
MFKYKLSIDNCISGDVIAVDVFSNEGFLIVSENTVVNEIIKNKLSSFGISKIWIYRMVRYNQYNEDNESYTDFKDTFKCNTDSLESLVNNLVNGKDTDLNELNIISEYIYIQISSNKDLIKYLNVIKDFDDYTFTHSLNVAFYCALMCRWMKLGANKTKSVVKTALLHDMGKVKIPASILNKKGQLKPDEFDIIKTHSQHGYNIIKNIDGISQDIKMGILLHHERIDGSGYPLSLCDNQLNLNARIVAIADTYDALISDRAYRSGYTPFKAFKILLSENLTAYDLTIMNIFIKNIPHYYIGSKVRLSSGIIGEVIHIPEHCVDKPIILVDTSFIDLSRETELDIVSME